MNSILFNHDFLSYCKFFNGAISNLIMKSINSTVSTVITNTSSLWNECSISVVLTWSFITDIDLHVY